MRLTVVAANNDGGDDENDEKSANNVDDLEVNHKTQRKITVTNIFCFSLIFLCCRILVALWPC